ncbi:hypothetical protein AB6A40_004575 [Gnathostoma spinigerum]|uniref:Uncharacterized protein n=1 Tax=Gnathostoma spinigerum TaxID=75299 RepID=A0ABD6EF67_9BILA
MTSGLGISVLCFSLISVLVGFASLGLLAFILLKDRLFPVNDSSMLRADYDIEQTLPPHFISFDSTDKRNNQIFSVGDNGPVIDLTYAGLEKMDAPPAIYNKEIQPAISNSISTEKNDVEMETKKVSEKFGSLSLTNKGIIGEDEQRSSVVDVARPRQSRSERMQSYEWRSKTLREIEEVTDC